MLVSPADGATIIEQSDRRGRELAKVCKKHPQARKAINAISNGNDITALIAGEITLTMALLANHPETQARVVNGVVSTFRRFFNRGHRGSVAATSPVPPTETSANDPGFPPGFNPAEPPEQRVVTGKLPVFHAQKSHNASVAIQNDKPVTDYAEFDTAAETQRMVEAIGLATG